jgi:outer membrane autotransporter protein
MQAMGRLRARPSILRRLWPLRWRLAWQQHHWQRARRPPPVGAPADLNVWAPNGVLTGGVVTPIGGTGTWSTTLAAWTDAALDAVPTAMSPQPGIAIFEGTGGTVTVFDNGGASPVNASGLQFAVDGYTLKGDTLTLIGTLSGGAITAPVISVGDGTSASAGDVATIGNVLAGSDGLTKADFGTLVLTAANAYTGGTTVTGGTLEIAAGGTPGHDGVVVDDSADLGSTLKVDAGAALTNHIVLNSGGALDNAGSLAETVDGGVVESFTGGVFVRNHSGGEITGGQTGVWLRAGGTVDNDGAGSVISAANATSGSNGVFVNGGTGTVSNTNGASIHSTQTGVWLFAGGSVVNDGAGSTISASGVVGYGVAINGAGAAVSNTHGGTITGGQIGVSLANGGSIVNGAGSTIASSGSTTGSCWVTAACAIFSATDADAPGIGLGGALTLTNAGTITGNVQMDASAANHTTLTAGGSIAGDLAMGDSLASTLTLDGAGTQLWSQAVTGATTFNGTLTMAGTGTWVIDSDDLGTLAGTTIAGGTLQVGNGGTAGSIGNGSVDDNGALAFDRSDDVSYTGTISGTGSLTQLGNGTLTLAGANTFSGGTAIDAGTIAIGSNASLGTGKVAMAAGSTLAFTSDHLVLANALSLSGDPRFNVATAGQTDTLSGAIADGAAPGSFEKAGAGTLILIGANAWTGGTTISAGILQVGSGGTAGTLGSGAIVDNGTLVFDLSRTVSLPAGLTGNGSLVQQGSGGFVVNGDDSGFAGTTTIQTGTATIGDDGHPAGNLGGMVTVAQGATLNGIGTAGGLDVAGTMSPGNSIGTFHVAGDATFESGSTFSVEANSDGTADQLTVGGKTTIKGGNTVVLSQPGNWNTSTTYTIITSIHGVTGTFDGVSDDQAFLTPQLTYAPNDVILTLTRNEVSFPNVAVTLNQKGSAAGIEGIGSGNALYDAVVRLTADQARAAFDAASGEYHASQQTARLEDSRYIREAMNQRLRAGDADPETTKIGHLTAWAHAWGHWGTVDGDGNAAKLSDNGDGLLAGADLPVGAARIGVTGGATRNSLNINDRASWGRETSTWLGAFAGVDVSAFSLRGGLAYAWDRIPVHREVNFPGYADRLGGESAGDTLTGFIEGAWTFKFGNGLVSPFLNVAHTKVETNAVTETGGVAALRAFDAATNVSFSTLGARGQVNFAHDLNVHGELGWQHAFGDTTPEATLQFVAGGPAFTEYGVPVAKNAGLGRIGLGWHQGNVAVSADYEGLSGGGVKDQATKVSVSVMF